MNSDLDLLSTFDHRHQRTKLALYCCTSRTVYLLRALPLEVVLPESSKRVTPSPAMQLATIARFNKSATESKAAASA